MKVKKKIIFIVAIVLITTVLVIFGIQKESKAFYFFKTKPITFDYCEFELEKDEFDWTGEAICPNLKVSYNGKELKYKSDYRLSYKNNINAGIAQVKVKPAYGGNFIGRKEIDFKIKGINIKDIWKVQFKNINEATGQPFNDELIVYNGTEVVDSNNYEIDQFITSKLIKDEKYYDTYELTTQFIVKGIGKYEGFVTCEKKGAYKELSPGVYIKIFIYAKKIMDIVSKFGCGTVMYSSGLEETGATSIKTLSEDVIIIDENNIDEYADMLKDLCVSEPNF